MIKNHSFILALTLSIPTALFAQGKLIFAVDIIRHGDRTPLSTIPTVNYQWEAGRGQLTPEGMQQEYNLGRSFRHTYIEENHLLPEKYQPGTMFVRSTYYDRTQMSAQSLLMGLYPPGTGPITGTSSPALPHALQPIPIFSAPAKLDDVIVQKVDKAEYDKLLEELVYNSQPWQEKNESLKANYPLWSQLTGVNIKTLDDLQILGDTLFIHQLHKAPLPEGLSQEDLDSIIKASQWAFMAQERPKALANLSSTQLMTNIAGYLNNGSHQDSKLKYVLLSAHDVTIASALSYLGAPLDTPPPYASNLNFSLYEDNTVKITYNGKPVSIPGCGGEVCGLAQFVGLVNH